MILGFVDVLKKYKILAIILVIVVALLLVSLMWIYRKKKYQNNVTVKEVSTIGIFTALSMVLYLLKFNLPIFPPFLEFNFSLLPIIIIGFMMGPIEGVTIVLLRGIIKLSMTSTFCVGEVADILIGIPVILVTSLIYKKHHTRKGAIVSLLLGILTWIVAGVLSNYLINVPFFLELYCNGNVEAFISALSVIPGVTAENYMIKYLIYATVPFNALLATVVSFVTFIVYKKISILFEKITKEKQHTIVE
jgi:riboflavin transporter FmnP